MVHDHTKALAMFEQQHDAKLGDAALQSFINDEIPVLRRHLNKAKDIQKQLSSDTKTRPSGTPATR
jgi:predicted outer membrane protein